MSTELAELSGTTTDLAIDAAQGGFSDKQVTALLAMIGVEDVPQPELDVFFHVAKRSGLDPFAKQIYLIARTKRVNKGNNNWVDDGYTYTIQTGIDGYRLNGKRAARREGVTFSMSAPEWRGSKSGDTWDDVWLDKSTPPAAARVSITVGESTFTAVAMYHEYVQTKGNNGGPNSMWSKMPANQLRKCAEAAAWRLAFPDDFSGLELEDAMQNGQIIDEDGEPAPVKRVGGRGNAAARAALGVKPKGEPAETESEPVDVTAGTVVDEQPSPSNSGSEPEPSQASTPESKPIGKGQVSALTRLFAKEKYESWSDQLEWLANNNIVGDRKITGLGDLTYGEAAAAIETLQ